MGVSDKRLAPGASFVYLITNRHMAQPGLEDGTPCEVVNYSVRLNLATHSSNESSQLVPLGEKPGWQFPDDPAVDLAAMSFQLNPAMFDVEIIPDSLIVTQSVMQARQVAEGDPVIFTGLFVQYAGQVKMEPIVRTGTLAMLPTEKVVATLKKPARVYLAEAHVFGGNSGSPMFINLGGTHEGSFSGPDYKLIGVVAGEIFETQNLELKPTSSYKGDIHANSGISIIVPADEIAPLLNAQAFQVKRDAIIAAQPKP